tara:strand:- start:1066 stop:1560 length:495 start_codon:yes stop_codon:yes gene_type:complete
MEVLMIDAIAVEILEYDDVVAIVRDESDGVDRETVEEMLQEFGNYEAWDYVADAVWEASREAIHDIDFSEYVDVDESILDMLRSYIRIKGDGERTNTSLCSLGKAVEEAIELTIKRYVGEGDRSVAQRDLYERLVVRMNELEQQVQVLSEALATAGERASSVRQ